MFGPFNKLCYIHPPKTKYFYIHPHLKKNLGPPMAWALGRRTPGLCLGSALLEII